MIFNMFKYSDLKGTSFGRMEIIIAILNPLGFAELLKLEVKADSSLFKLLQMGKPAVDFPTSVN